MVFHSVANIGNTEFSEWLYSIGFHQSPADPSYFVRYDKHGQWIRLIFYVDDMLYPGSNDQLEKDFEQDVAKRFHVKFMGAAQWFLQMRLHQHNDLSYTLDQHRFALNAVKRYDPKTHLSKGTLHFHQTTFSLKKIVQQRQRTPLS